MSNNELENTIMSLERKFAEVDAELRTLRKVKSERESRAFIAVNRITKDDVEMPDGDGKPWFGNVSKFIEWMRATGVTKRWASWNGIIFHTSDLLADRFLETPGRVDHLPAEVVR